MSAVKERKFAFKSAKKTAGGADFEPEEVKDGRGALQAVLNITLNHTAEVLIAMVTAISDHYKIPKEEMMDVVQAHPAYKSIILNPVLNDLGYCHPTEATAAAPAELEGKPEPKPKKKFIVRRMTPPNEPAD